MAVYIISSDHPDYFRSQVVTLVRTNGFAKQNRDSEKQTLSIMKCNLILGSTEAGIYGTQ